MGWGRSSTRYFLNWGSEYLRGRQLFFLQNSSTVDPYCTRPTTMTHFWVLLSGEKVFSGLVLGAARNVHWRAFSGERTWLEITLKAFGHFNKRIEQGTGQVRRTFFFLLSVLPKPRPLHQTKPKPVDSVPLLCCVESLSSSATVRTRAFIFPSIKPSLSAKGWVRAVSNNCLFTRFFSLRLSYSSTMFLRFVFNCTLVLLARRTRR